MENWRTTGINFRKATGHYVARWTPRSYVREHIGVFNTFEEAKAARDEKIRTLK